MQSYLFKTQIITLYNYIMIMYNYFIYYGGRRNKSERRICN